MGRYRDGPVLFLLGTLQIGGSETKFANMAVRMNASGLPVHVAYLSPPEDLKDKLADLPLVYLHRRGKWSIEAMRKLSRYVEQEQIRTIVTVNPYPLSYAVPLAGVRRSGRIKVVASINTSEFLSKRESRFMLLFSVLLRRCATIVFGARSQEQQWVGQYKLPADRSRVIYNGVDSTIFDPAVVAGSRASLRQSHGIPDNAFVIVSVGQFRPEKAHADLVKALLALKHRGLSPHILFVGDGPEEGRVRALVHDSGLDELVHFVGAVADVRQYLKMSDLFALTSIAVETFSNAALEAAVMGLRVVISDVGGSREMFPADDYSTVYPRGDIDSLVSAIARNMVDGRLSDDSAKQIRASIAERFSVSSMDARWSETLWTESAHPEPRPDNEAS